MQMKTKRFVKFQEINLVAVVFYICMHNWSWKWQLYVEENQDWYVWNNWII